MTQQRAETYNLLTVGVGGQGVISASNILAWAALRDNYKVRTAETHGMAQRGGSVSSYLRFGDLVEGPLIPKGSANGILSFELVEALRNVSYANKNTRFVVSTNIQVSPTVLVSRRLMVDNKKCVGCGNCISYCYPNYLKDTFNHPYTFIPCSPIDVSNGKRGEIKLCTGCGACIDDCVCAFEAMHVESTLYYPTLSEVVQNIKKISPYIYLIDAVQLAKQSGSALTQNIVMVGFLSGLDILPIDREILFKTMIEQVPPKAVELNKVAFELGEKAAREYNEEEMLKKYATTTQIQ
jgi:Pyruvate/2-oxoacid:ferredoxin oxidoreductase gamma subunit